MAIGADQPRARQEDRRPPPRRCAAAPSPAPRRRRCRCPATRARRPRATAGSRARDERAIDDLEPSTPFSVPRALQRFERRHLVLVVRDDQLAAARRAARRGARRTRTAAGGPRRTAAPSASGRVVDAGVNDAAVVRARVEPGRGWRSRTQTESPRRAMARAAARPVTPRADDGDVDLFHAAITIAVPSIPMSGCGSRWRRSRGA